MMTDYADPNVPNGSTTVVAGTDIPVGAVLGPFPSDFYIELHATDFREIKYSIEVNFTHGRFVCPYLTSVSWIKFIQPARDRHEQNAEIGQDPAGKSYFRTIRTVKKGEHFYIWYQDAYAIDIGIPVLSMKNIRGVENYICTECRGTFKYPNSLKSHMRFTCPMQRGSAHLPKGNLKISMRIHTCPHSTSVDTGKQDSKFVLQNNDLVRLQHPFDFHEKNEIHEKCGNYTCRDIYLTDAKRRTADDSSLKRMYHRYGDSNTDHCGLHGFLCRAHGRNLGCSGHNPILQASISVSSDFQMPHQTQDNAFFNHGHYNGEDCINHGYPLGQQEMTSLPLLSSDAGEPIDLLHKSVINLASKRGHLCVYCGKFYSRKYGLKIHLRTHTGYKPLKCKICFRAFGDPSNLNKHVRLHAEGQTPYKCEICDKVLVRRRDLERHLKSRHPVAKHEQNTMTGPTEEECHE